MVRYLLNDFSFVGMRNNSKLSQSNVKKKKVAFMTQHHTFGKSLTIYKTI